MTIVLLVAFVPAAQAEPLVQEALHQQHRLGRELDRVQEEHGVRVRTISHEMAQLDHRLRTLTSGSVLGRSRWGAAHRHLHGAIFHLRIRLMRFERYTQRRLTRLLTARAELGSWLDTWGVFHRCPVGGPNVVADNFGITVRLPNVPVHTHMGNDISAASGTPIVAPFDGYTSTSSSPFGGLEVRVHGENGYVYNAHLSAYGTLGDVHMGDVIGYVGATGDATASHDHFEWHPDDGVAADPNALLSVVC